MLYRILKRMIEHGQTEGLEQKIKMFYDAKKLTKDEYDELIKLLANQPS